MKTESVNKQWIWTDELNNYIKEHVEEPTRTKPEWNILAKNILEKFHFSIPTITLSRHYLTKLKKKVSEEKLVVLRDSTVPELFKNSSTASSFELEQGSTTPIDKPQKILWTPKMECALYQLGKDKVTTEDQSWAKIAKQIEELFLQKITYRQARAHYIDILDPTTTKSKISDEESAQIQAWVQEKKGNSYISRLLKRTLNDIKNHVDLIQAKHFAKDDDEDLKSVWSAELHTFVSNLIDNDNENILTWKQIASKINESYQLTLVDKQVQKLFFDKIVEIVPHTTITNEESLQIKQWAEDGESFEYIGKLLKRPTQTVEEHFKSIDDNKTLKRTDITIKKSRRASWSEEIDSYILDHIKTKYTKTTKVWSKIAADIKETFKKTINRNAIRERYTNQLDPNLIKTALTEKEWSIIYDLRTKKKGWSAIGEELNRAPNFIKNQYNSNKRKKQPKKIEPPKPNSNPSENISIPNFENLTATKYEVFDDKNVDFTLASEFD